MAGKKIKCRLKDNRHYGTSLRRGASGDVYVFSLFSETEVTADDLKAFRDKNSDQYEPYLVIIKD